MNRDTLTPITTRRRDQRGYRHDDGTDGDALIGGILFCTGSETRDAWIQRLRRLGFNHFTCFRDVHCEFALQYGRSDWAAPGAWHVNR